VRRQDSHTTSMCMRRGCLTLHSEEDEDVMRSSRLRRNDGIVVHVNDHAHADEVVD
jgi:hypothetical protein